MLPVVYPRSSHDSPGESTVRDPDDECEVSARPSKAVRATVSFRTRVTLSRSLVRRFRLPSGKPPVDARTGLSMELRIWLPAIPGRRRRTGCRRVERICISCTLLLRARSIEVVRLHARGERELPCRISALVIVAKPIASGRARDDAPARECRWTPSLWNRLITPHRLYRTRLSWVDARIVSSEEVPASDILTRRRCASSDVSRRRSRFRARPVARLLLPVTLPGTRILRLRPFRRRRTPRSPSSGTRWSPRVKIRSAAGGGGDSDYRRSR